MADESKPKTSETTTAKAAAGKKDDAKPERPATKVLSREEQERLRRKLRDMFH